MSLTATRARRREGDGLCVRPPRRLGFLSLVLAAICGAGVGAPGTPQPDDPTKKSPAELKKGIENAHPATFYVLASKLFEGNKKDEAVFWLYAGQLRYRFHLSANPNLDPSGDPALFASLSEVIGRPINEYAFGDLKELRRTLDRVLKWDEDNPNGFTSKAAHAPAWKETRAGLQRLLQYVRENAAELRRQRRANGLENRTTGD